MSASVNAYVSPAEYDALVKAKRDLELEPQKALANAVLVMACVALEGRVDAGFDLNLWREGLQTVHLVVEVQP